MVELILVFCVVVFFLILAYFDVKNFYGDNDDNKKEPKE